MKWVKRWRMSLSEKPVLPGVWAIESGGFFVRGRVVNPKTGRLEYLTKVMKGVDAPTALKWLADQERQVRRGGGSPSLKLRKRFAVFVVEVKEARESNRDIQSDAARDKWSWELRRLISDEWQNDSGQLVSFGEMFVDEIAWSDIAAWKRYLAGITNLPRTDPRSLTIPVANGLIRKFKFLTRKASEEPYCLIQKDPAASLETFSERDHVVYTKEQPNRLTPTETETFLRIFRTMFPQHFGMAALAFATGLRPSQIRPLRRCGPEADVNWDEKWILLRRSNSRGQGVMNRTKTTDARQAQDDYRYLSKDLMDVLKWHVDTQLHTRKQRESELLFPAEHGGFRARSVLDKPFKTAAKAAGLKLRITPGIGARRSNKDAMRLAKIDPILAKAMSGHSTDAMQDHYSSPLPSEGHDASARVGTIIGLRVPQSTEAGVRFKLYEVEGVTRTLEEWAQATGIGKSTLHYRLSKGMTMAEAISVVRRSGKPLAAIQAAYGSGGVKDGVKAPEAEPDGRTIH